MNFEELLKFAVAQGASDIHLQASSPPQLRIGGLIRNVEGPVVEPLALRQFAASIAPPAIAEDIDGALFRGARFSRSIDGLARFRCCVYGHRGQPGLVMHVIPAAVATLEQLNLPAVLKEVAQTRRGITLVTGPSGSGRSTTLAALVDVLSEGTYGKIVTLENPIEVLHHHKRALIAQREIGSDVPSMAEGIEQAIAQDADVIVAGELHDAATARAALRASETGHQVLATMSSPNSVQALERLIGLVPAEEKRLVTGQVAEALVAVVAQKLASTKDGKRRPVVEVLRGGQYTTRCILENRWTDLSNYIASRQGGMQQLEQHLLELYQAGAISGTEAMRLATNPEAVAEGMRMMRRGTPSA
ncbi:MAG: ATPase, T2SS/T4P/T4SS family [Isosphaeraceae bacterium]